MIEQQTVEAAKGWCRTGESWIEKGATNLGMNYLDKAIPVFREIDDDSWLTYTLHLKLKAYKQQDQFEQVDSMFEAVMAGYVRLDDNYGKALLLMHHGESVSRHGHQERALAVFNLALEITEGQDAKDLAAFILKNIADIYLDRGTYLQALRMLRRAEQYLDDAENIDESTRVRQMMAEALSAMGESGEAIALLEDVQTRLWDRKQYREAVKPLTLLNKLYTATKAAEDKERIGQLLHWAAQRVIHEDDNPEGESRSRRTSPLVGRSPR